MQIELVPTTCEQLPLIANLYQYYAYESSDWEDEDVEVDGRFYIHQPHLARYWSEPQWSAQLILADGFIAGFLLIERSELPGIDALELADLFVLKKYRRLGVGRCIAMHVLMHGSQRWLVSHYRQDAVAAEFCRAILEQLPALSWRPLQSSQDPDLCSIVIEPPHT